MDMSGPIGLVADSHGRSDLLVQAILMLKGMGVREIVHLGDICDSLAPLALEDAVAVLKEYSVQAIRGNNECAILINHQGERRGNIPAEVLSYLEGLPYTLVKDDICFAHSAPFEWPAATTWPITDNHPFVDMETAMPYRILFRGHSHTPSIVEIQESGVKLIPAETGVIMHLMRERRYVITVGAIELKSFALFLPEDYKIQFLQLAGT